MSDNRMVDMPAPVDEPKDIALVGEPLPQICFLEDLSRHLRMTIAQIHELRRAGVFPLRELPRLDRRPRWSGEEVRRYLQGETRVVKKPWKSVTKAG